MFSTVNFHLIHFTCREVNGHRKMHVFRSANWFCELD